MPSAHGHFSEQFQRWERRGRGWQVFAEPVKPEPPFVPFTLRPMTDAPVADRGVRPSFLGSMLGFGKKSTPPVELEPEEEPEPQSLVQEKLTEFQASLPDKLDVPRDAFEQFLSNLSLCQEPIAFELLGIHKKVTAQFAAGESAAPLLRRQLSAFFPEAVFIPVEKSLESAWNSAAGEETLAVEFGLEKEFMLPLASGKLDPFIGIIGALSELQSDELGLFQVLFQPVQNPWAESITASVTHRDGKPFFVDAPELAGAAENKIKKPIYSAVVRIMVCAGACERVLQLASDLAGSLRVFAYPGGNALIPLHNEQYPFADHIEDVLRRQSRRAGMLVNSDELTGFVHIPSSTVRSPVFQRDAGRTKAVPAILQQPGVIIGDNEHNGRSVPVRLTADQRVRHTHIVGSSGTGKSSLLLNLIRQDVERGDGVAVLDPHGDLINQILGIIPEHRIGDVVLVNPSDVEFPIGFNILQAHSDEEKNLLASDLIAVFRRLASSWGDQMDAVLQNAILAFLESKQGGTLADLRRFLLEPPFRSQCLQTVEDPEIIYYWQKVFPQLTGGKSIGPVLTRLQDFFSRKPLRNMVSQRNNKLDFADIMDSGKIFLASLSEGLCGVENSYLLGTLLVSKFQQLAMARQAQQAAVRRDFWLYVDEFDHFISPSMAEILKGTRKYRLGLTLAHQELHQLKSDPKVESAVLTQPCTRIVFRVGDDDAKRLGDGFESFDARSLKNLEKFHAIARVERNDFDFNLAVRKPEAPDPAHSHVGAIIAASRQKYATPRAEVEAALLASIRNDTPAVPTTPAKASQPPAAEIQKPVVAPKAEAAVTTVSGKKEAALPASADDADEEGQHNAIKERIRVQAEALDYSVAFEEFVGDTQGRADVVLRRGDRSIACEITVTTPVEYEVGNLTKCLQGKFSHVAAISRSRKKLERIRQLLAESLPPEECASVAFYSPEEFISKLHDWALNDPAGGATEKGKPHRRVIDLNAPGLTEAERKQREEDMLKSLTDLMRR